MNRLLGYTLMGAGLLVLFFFSKYNGTAIANKGLWIVLGIFILIAGGYFFGKYKLQELNNQTGDSNSDQLRDIERLKRTGDRVRVTLDNAEVKSRSYQQEIINDGLPSRIEILDGLYDSNSNYKTQDVQQTYIVFYKQYAGRTFKFVSPAMTQSAETVKMHIDRQNGVDLYIDPMNPDSYYFDLTYL